MSYVIVDVEADGPIPGEFSMVCFGAVVFRKDLIKLSMEERVRSQSDSFQKRWQSAGFPSKSIRDLTSQRM